MLDREIFDVIGYAGAALFVLAYMRLQHQRDFAKSFAYSSMNALGAVCLIVSLLRDWNMPTVVMSAAWLAISLFGMHRCWLYIRRGEQLNYHKRMEKLEKDTQAPR